METPTISNLVVDGPAAAPAPPSNPAPPPVPETPTATIVRSAVKTARCEDVNGKRYSIRRLMPSDRMRIMDVLGPDRTKNEVILGNAMIVASITEIDGGREGTPTSWAQLLATMDRVGDDGINAVAACMQKEFGIAAGDGDPAAIKN